jgi:hypothetical protein
VIPKDDDPLLGCRLKLQQAWRHLQTLDEEVARFLDGTESDPPLYLGVIVGDFLHNLRCELDHLIWQLVILNGKEPTHSHQFPICDTRDGFDKQAPRRLAGLTAAQLAAVEELQPYRIEEEARWHTLAVLRDLSNIDKHRRVHVTTVIGEEGDREVAFTDLQVSLNALGRLLRYMNYTVHERFAAFFPLPSHR